MPPPPFVTCATTFTAFRAFASLLSRPAVAAVPGRAVAAGAVRGEDLLPRRGVGRLRRRRLLALAGMADALAAARVPRRAERPVQGEQPQVVAVRRGCDAFPPA